MFRSFKSPYSGFRKVPERLWIKALDDDILGRSAQLSYYFFLALFPALICLLALLRLFAGSGDTLRLGMLHFMTSVLPGTASELIQKTLSEVTASSARSKIPLGILFSVWSASAGMSALMDTLNSQREIGESRSFVRRNLTAIGLMGACTLLLLGSLAIVLAGGSVADAFSDGVAASFFKIVQWPLAFALILFGFELIYFFGPDVDEQEWRWVTPGAICSLVLWLAVSLALKVYIHFFNTYSATYGSLGAVII